MDISPPSICYINLRRGFDAEVTEMELVIFYVVEGVIVGP
jgi:hypothetical protein